MSCKNSISKRYNRLPFQSISKRGLHFFLKMQSQTKNQMFPFKTSMQFLKNDKSTNKGLKHLFDRKYLLLKNVETSLLIRYLE